ncbi:MAG: lysophospholipid acyltransferase family protein, partial [Planctomycetota bacterium]
MSGTAGRRHLALRDRHPGSTGGHRVFFEFCRSMCQLFLVSAYRTIEIDGHRVPQTGPLLVVANHQSFLDPPAIGVAGRPRHFDFIARGGLFDNPAFARLISACNSIPIREEGGDAAAMKEALRRTAMGRAVLVFPEASRTKDGATQPFKRGVAV